MSISISDLLPSLPLTDLSQRLILLRLADESDSFGRANISIHKLARLCGINKETAEETLKSLEDLGLIKNGSAQIHTSTDERVCLLLPSRWRYLYG